MRTKWALLLIGFFATSAARAQDEAASALADCQAHQQRVQELEDGYTPPPDPSGINGGPGLQPQRFGENDLQHERNLMERACDYAKVLRAASTKPAPRTATTERAAFRSDEPTTATDGGSAARGRMPEPPAKSSPPVFDEHPPIRPASPPPPPRPSVRRPPPPPAQPSVGGTKARHAADEQPSPPPTPPQ